MPLRFRAIVKGRPSHAYSAASVRGVYFLEREHLHHAGWTVGLVFADSFRQVQDWFSETDLQPRDQDYPAGSLLWFAQEVR
jgi:hypothetical protein